MFQQRYGKAGVAFFDTLPFAYSLAEKEEPSVSREGGSAGKERTFSRGKYRRENDSIEIRGGIVPFASLDRLLSVALG